MSTSKSFEKKVLHCVDARTYVRVVEKKSEEGYLSDSRMSLSSKTFENHPSYVFLVSARLCGERKHIHEFIQLEDKNLSESYKTLVSRDLEQAMTKDNYNSDSLIQEYQLSVVGANPTIITTSRTPYESVFTRETLFHKDQKKKRAENENEKLGWDHLSGIVNLLINDPHSVKITDKIAPLKTVNRQPAKVVNKLAEKNAKAAEAGKWYDVSKCVENCTGMVSHNDRPDGVYTFLGYPELSRIFFNVKRDNTLSSPHKGVKNIGPAYCLKYYHEHCPTSSPKSFEACLEEVAELVRRQRK